LKATPLRSDTSNKRISDKNKSRGIIFEDMTSRLARVQTTVVSHPRLVASLLIVLLFLIASGSAVAVDGVGGLDGVTLGDVGTNGIGNTDGGPTDP
jgi:hypothetical protein